MAQVAEGVVGLISKMPGVLGQSVDAAVSAVSAESRLALHTRTLLETNPLQTEVYAPLSF